MSTNNAPRSAAPQISAPHLRELGSLVPGFTTQFERVTAAFGGRLKLYNLISIVSEPVARAAYLRWNYPKERRGTGGHIPVPAWQHIFKAAEFAGVEITYEMLDPRLKPISPMFRILAELHAEAITKELQEDPFS